MKCDLDEDETVMHVVVECEKYDSTNVPSYLERERFLNVLRNECEEDWIVEWMERDDKGLGVLFV